MAEEQLGDVFVGALAGEQLKQDGGSWRGRGYGGEWKARETWSRGEGNGRQGGAEKGVSRGGHTGMLLLCAKHHSGRASSPH